MEKINGILTSTHVEVEELKNHINQTVKIHGMVYKIREMSGFAFVIIRTKRTLLQCVYSEEFSQFPLNELKDNMSVVISGQVINEERSRTGIEVRIISYECLSRPADEVPVVINNKELEASLETLLDYRPATLRHAKERAIFQIQAGIGRGIRQFLDENKFVEIHSPKIVYSGAEGGANIFKLDYFGKEAYLTQSPQFYKQTMIGIFERVYEIAPVFRAEKHDTSRHVNEYISVDIEMGFIESFYDIMKTETKMLAHVFDYLRENYAEELKLLNTNIPVVTEIPIVTFDEAKEMVSKAYNRKITDFEDFEPEEEKLLSELIKKRTKCDFVFVSHYKASKRPFYAMNTPDNPKLTDSFDLIFRGMEITTGGQRIHDYHQQVQKMQSLGMNVELFESYLMAHKYGLPPHGGFGLGLERFTAKLLNFNNIRHATLFPRDTIRLEP